MHVDIDQMRADPERALKLIELSGDGERAVAIAKAVILGETYAEVGRRFDRSGLTAKVTTRRVLKRGLEAEAINAAKDNLTDETPIEHIGFSNRLKHSLLNDRIETLGDLRKRVNSEGLTSLLEIQNFGRKSFHEVAKFFGVDAPDRKAKLAQLHRLESRVAALKRELGFSDD